MTLDFAAQSDYLVALLPEIVLSIFGMIVLLVGVRGRGREAGSDGGSLLGQLSLAGVVLAAWANAWLYGVSVSGEGGVIALDEFRLFANWVILAAGALSILLSGTYARRQGLQAGELHALLLLAMVGAMVMVGSPDLIVIFLGLEVMSVSVYALTGFNRRDRRSAEAGLKYFLLGAFSTAFFLFGITLIWGATGETRVDAIAASVAAGAANPLLILPGIALLTVGFGFKVSAVPFHMWAPDVYQGAPLPVTAFMSTAVKAAAFVAFFRVFFVGLHELSADWTPVLWWIAAVTMVAANLLALVQSNVKRMLAYSSVAHAGYLLVGIVALNETAGAGLLFYLAVYTFMNIGAFAIVTGFARQREERLQIDDYAGFGWREPLVGVVFTVFLLSLAGFPGTGGFIAKAYLLLGAVESELWSLSVVLVLTTVVSYGYYLRVAWTMWMKEPRGTEDPEPALFPAASRLVLAVSAVVILASGVIPGSALGAARAGVRALLAGAAAVSGAPPVP